MNKKHFLYNVIKEFFNPSKVLNIRLYGNGLINKTYLVEFKDIKYIIQKINSHVFTSPMAVMHNIDLITNHLRKKLIYEGKNFQKRTLTLIQTKHNENFAIVDDEYWRCYICIEGTTFEETTDPNLFYQAGVAIGEFQTLLNDFHTPLLNDNIKNFHNTPKRYIDFLNIVEKDKYHRKQNCLKEIDFIIKRKDKMHLITDSLTNKKIPLRVVHNDTKLNNIMFDYNYNALCLIDLDTTMKGSMLYDFGDALRKGASTTSEDDNNLDNVLIDFQLVESFIEGFLLSVKDIITDNETNLLYEGYYILTLELGMRFLTDYLDNDNYFTLDENQKKNRPDINLDRAKNQLKLLSEIENNELLIRDIINSKLKLIKESNND